MDFTLCFQDSLLTILPSGLLLIVLAPRLYKVLSKGRLEGVSFTAWFSIKMACIVAALALQIALLAVVIQRPDYQTAAILSSVLYIVSISGALLLHYFEHFNMPNPSGILLVYWLFTALIAIFPARSLIEELSLQDRLAVLKLVFAIVVMVVFVLENIPKQNYRSLKRTSASAIAAAKPDQPNPSPEPYANFFIRITFLWLVPLLNKGKKRPLRMDDIWNLHPKMLSYSLFLTSQAKLDADEAIARQQAEDEAKAHVMKDADAAAADGDDAKTTITTTTTQPSKAKELRKVRLLNVIMHTVGWSFLTAVVPRLLYIPSLYVRPILFSGLIAFMDSYSVRSQEANVVPEPAWKGYGLAIAIVSTSLLSGLFEAQFTNLCFQSAVRARGAIVGLIYRKALRLSSTNKQEGIGAIVNHMSTDVDRVILVFTVIHYIWGGVIEVAIIAVLLWNEIGYVMFATLSIVILMIGAGGGCAVFMGRFYERMMAESDKRMKLIGELVNHVKSIKLYAWERFFVKNITEARLRQLAQLRRLYLWESFVATMFNSVNALATFISLTAYSAISGPDQPLDIRRIFVTITLINMLHPPLGLISEALPTLVSGNVAFGRLKKFLESEEINTDNLLHDSDPNASGIAYEIRDGTFGWYTPEAIEDAVKKREQEAKEKAEKEAKEAKENKKAGLDVATTMDETGQDEKKAVKGKPMSEKAATSTDKKEEEEGEALAKASSPSAARETMGPVLHNISLKIQRGSLTAIVGRVGEGKSSLVGALLGELYKYQGTVRSYGSLAYVAQSAWILNDTVRNNILFGLAYDKERYLQVIQSCALVPDFKMLVSGDKTVIGEKGINLSGGQKQRISIARAVYANADVYIFDDPLSAVDAHVDRHIFSEAINKLLATKTRILVTNGVHHLKDVDQLIVVKQGKISQDGAYDELIKDTGGDLYRLIEESQRTHGELKGGDSSTENSDDGSASETEDEVEEVQEAGKDAKETADGHHHQHHRHHHKSSHQMETEDLDLTDHKEVDEEVTLEGRVGWEVYKYYLYAVGMTACITLLILAIGYMVCEFNTQLWIKNWGNDNELKQPKHNTTYWILTYFAWMLSSNSMLSFSVGVTLVVLARRASKNLHASMLGPLVRSPMSFFDVTSSGKIVNRFSHDISLIDIDLPINFLNLLFILMIVLLQFAYAVAASVYFLILLVPLLGCYYYLAGFFLVSSRELKRLDSAARSPMYAHFGETLNGLMTIRGFGHGERFALQATKMLDQSQQVYYLTNSSQRWLQMMLEVLSVIVMGVIALLAVLQRSSASAGVFGIVLSQIGNLTYFVRRLMMEYCMLETNIVSVERIREYSRLPSEARDVIPDSKLDEEWPQRGQIEFQNYSTRYREGLDLVLHKISLSIQAGERIGIVGRTGAGKSSVTLALFRMIEAAEGSIWIDGIDIATLGLHDLRSRLTIIPQDPFLFGGTIRLNLDPFDEWQDADIWAALESASLKTYVTSLPEGLNTSVENGGENMSLGQRQLMSLARAMLHRHTKVLCLDEATAAIDIETDNAIQRALRRSFNDCTVLTIAHRINTIMDSDRILVLDHGQVAEFAPPQTLLDNPNSIFYSLAKTSEAAKAS
ncbi:hypothetical protein DFQ26_006121 [Actinomortierella ambigua]|nr:hypothetical protein DFQ26_006121 [Actinomortierella ambigua]